LDGRDEKGIGFAADAGGAGGEDVIPKFDFPVFRIVSEDG
jgi:hypothetical protein